MKNSLLYVLLPFTVASYWHSMIHALEQLNLNIDFIGAAKNGSYDEMNDLLRKGAQVNFSSFGEDLTALHYAAQRGRVDVVDTLIAANAHVNDFGSDGQTPLILAASGGHVACVKSLIAANANLNREGPGMHTALHAAAEQNHCDCVRALVKAKADVNLVNQVMRTALHFAAGGGCATCVEALLESRDYTTDNFRRALDVALMNNRVDCVKAMAKHSYLLVPSKTNVLESRKRILSLLASFNRLRKENSQLDNIKSESLQFEVMSWNKTLQDDLVIVLLDELKRGREITGVALIRSKEAAVRYLLSAIRKIAVQIPSCRIYDDASSAESLTALIKEGLDARIKELKS